MRPFVELISLSSASIIVITNGEINGRAAESARKYMATSQLEFAQSLHMQHKQYLHDFDFSRITGRVLMQATKMRGQSALSYCNLAEKQKKVVAEKASVFGEFSSIYDNQFHLKNLPASKLMEKMINCIQCSYLPYSESPVHGGAKSPGLSRRKKNL
jgi:hypothetical protein